MLSLFHE
jgi:hypothetical protein